MFSPYAAMGNSPGMMVDPNGEMTKYAEDLTAAENDWLMNSPERRAWNLGRSTGRNGALSRMLGHNMGGDMMMLMYAGGGGSFRIDRDGSMSGTGAGARIMFELYLKYSNDLSQRYVPSNDDLTDLEFSDDILPGLQVSARSGKWMPANLDEVASAIQRSLSGVQSSGSGGWLSGLQMGLDILGSSEIPFLSQLADLGSGTISVFQGDYKGAALSLGGMFIPGLSQAKLVRKAAKTGTTLIDNAVSVLSKADYARIQNAATRINKPIVVVGSRAKGTAGAYSDWDYVIDGLNNKSWKKIKNSLPGSRSILDSTPRNIDIFKTLDPTKPHIIINPR